MENQASNTYGKLKRRIRILSVIFSLPFVFSCTQNHLSETIVGETQGTTYTIILVNPDKKISKGRIDSLLAQFDRSLSTYMDSSLISRINYSKDTLQILDTFGYFGHCYNLSEKIYKLSQGAFDPSVYPLVKGYGFMADLETPLNDAQIDSILNFVSFENGKHHQVKVNENRITFIKKHPNFKMDFNAIAQGYSVDVVSKFLEKEGIRNFYVEIGGEIRVKGTNNEGHLWRIGIDVPKNSLVNREIENILHVTNKSVATSGNYRKFYKKNGVKYSHTLNPQTGKPVKHSLLSATVIADDCATADALATAFMVMGEERSIEFIRMNPQLNVHAYMLVADSDTTFKRIMSPGFESYLFDEVDN